MKSKIISIFVMTLLIGTIVLSTTNIAMEYNTEGNGLPEKCQSTISNFYKMIIEPSDFTMLDKLDIFIHVSDSNVISTMNYEYHIYEGFLWKLHVTAYWNPPQGRNICLWVDTLTLPQGATFPECNCAIDQVTSTLEWTPTENQVGTYQISFGIGEYCHEPLDYLTVTVFVHPYDPEPVETFTIYAGQYSDITITGHAGIDETICLWADWDTLPEGSFFDECHCDIYEVSSHFIWTPGTDQVGTYIIDTFLGFDCGYYEIPYPIEIIVYPPENGDQYKDYPAGYDIFGKTIAIKELNNIPLLKKEAIQVVVKGPTTIERKEPYDPGDGRWRIDTEIISMELKGTFLGRQIRVEESSEKKSTGYIQQQNAGVDFPADSFFDVYIEVFLPPPFNVAYNRDPVHMNATIYEIPPYLDNYSSDRTLVPLYTKTGIFSIEPIGYIGDATHLLPPEDSGLNVVITRPKEGYLYLNDWELIPFSQTLIGGPITIEAESDTALDKVKFFIGRNLKNVDSSPPYSWTWNENPDFSQQLIRVIAYDNSGNKASDEIIVNKIF
jgi:hypothetical protein